MGIDNLPFPISGSGWTETSAEKFTFYGKRARSSLMAVTIFLVPAISIGVTVFLSERFNIEIEGWEFYIIFISIGVASAIYWKFGASRNETLIEINPESISGFFTVSSNQETTFRVLVGKMILYFVPDHPDGFADELRGLLQGKDGRTELVRGHAPLERGDINKFRRFVRLTRYGSLMNIGVAVMGLLIAVFSIRFLVLEWKPQMSGLVIVFATSLSLFGFWMGSDFLIRFFPGIDKSLRLIRDQPGKIEWVRVGKNEKASLMAEVLVISIGITGSKVFVISARKESAIPELLKLLSEIAPCAVVDAHASVSPKTISWRMKK